MKKKLIAGLAFLLSMVSMIGFANATLISGDFRTESDLTISASSSGPKVYEELGASIGSGIELTEADFKENPSNWGGGLVYMDYNPTTNILTLDSQDTWDFEIFDARISNIVFDSAEVISGISMLSNGITTPTFVPTFSFTANSLHIVWDKRPSEFYFTGGIAEFQISTSPVPEPATMLLLGTGLVGVAGAARRRKKKNQA